jgi:ribosome-binding factor A
MAELIKQLTAEFLLREATKSSLITVTFCYVSDDMKTAKIGISVFPETLEKTALEFAKRKSRELRDFIKKKVNTKVVPFLEIMIDLGEKNRQNIDQLLREK